MGYKRIIPKGMRVWPHNLVIKPEQLESTYVSGISGVMHSPAEEEALADSMQSRFGFYDGEQVAYDNNIVGLGKGKLTLLYVYAQGKWQLWPKPPQQTGDCVAKAAANSGIIIISLDVAGNKPDEVTGLIEGFPELTPLGIQQGVVADEPVYGDRGHSGEGANCERLIRHCTEQGGIILRKNYAHLNLNLESYSVEIGKGWGRSQTPEPVRALGREHQIRQAVKATNHEMCRDYLAAGKVLWACSGLGWSNQRDEFGYSKQQGGWGHSWIVCAYDDRKETIAEMGFPLFLFLHDWGKWNKGGVKVRRTNGITIPEGCFWGDARLLDRCNIHALAGVNGWAPQVLPPFNPKVRWF